MIRYYVSGIGYDVNGNITDYERNFGDYNTYVEAYEQFVKIQCENRVMLFAGSVGVNQMIIQLEECEETEDEINCIDVTNEWWITNPNYKEEV